MSTYLVTFLCDDGAEAEVCCSVDERQELKPAAMQAAIERGYRPAEVLNTEVCDDSHVDWTLDDLLIEIGRNFGQIY